MGDPVENARLVIQASFPASANFRMGHAGFAAGVGYALTHDIRADPCCGCAKQVLHRHSSSRLPCLQNPEGNARGDTHSEFAASLSSTKCRRSPAFAALVFAAG